MGNLHQLFDRIAVVLKEAILSFAPGVLPEIIYGLTVDAILLIGSFRQGIAHLLIAFGMDEIIGEFFVESERVISGVTKGNGESVIAGVVHFAHLPDGSGYLGQTEWRNAEVGLCGRKGAFQCEPQAGFSGAFL